MLKAIGIAAVVVVAAIAAYVFLGRKPPVHSGQVLSVHVYPIHRELKPASGTEGMQGVGDTYDQLILLADVSIKNETNIPLFLRDMYADVQLAETPQRSAAATVTNLEKVFVAYPELKQYQKTPLARDTTLQPGQQIEGLMGFVFPMSKAQWDSRTGEDLTFIFLHQNALKLHVTK
ncbi:hypothetical protein [Silvibacterium acidisoli]|uniref:hypothetical protein n=1 Tax=Acidobacteriaceae bacterium ZG23-2 TaxID=2883246 RepID=UPI00406C9E9E